MNAQLKIAICAAVLAVLCWIAEALFYGGRVDDNGVLQESLLLPLSFMLVAIAAIAAFFGLISAAEKKRRIEKSKSRSRL